MPLDVLKETSEIISYKSVTGTQDEGAILYLKEKLESLGFKTITETFKGDGSYDVLNLYAEYGKSGRNLCFAGHTDVVPAGDESKWTVNPFYPKIVDGYLIGRGAVDMKSSITAWLCAVSEFLNENRGFDAGKISMLITGDEEADAVNGTVKLLSSITTKGYRIDHCIVGEPSNPLKLGEMIKIGRRGSLSCTLTVNGVQGHVAYPEKAQNPNPIIIKILNELSDVKFDSGNQFFSATNLEVTTIDVANPTTNLIPSKATASFNIRFNNEQTRAGLIEKINEVCKKYTSNYELRSFQSNAEPFLSNPGLLADFIKKACKEVINKTPELSTTGGTSDARFIKDYCEVAEFGLTNETAHKIDEKVKVEDLYKLKDIYKRVIEIYFNS
ncbi:MAG TPA: succinyl-diaminopimelate desuccinylase [Alphaproteobacteria bacterium]|nr:succinyl-diaminopimelate desuccinylase [Alphaproteobacteria bacterium]